MLLFVRRYAIGLFVFLGCCIRYFDAVALGTFGSIGYSIEWMAQHSDAVGIYLPSNEPHSSRDSVGLILDRSLKASPPSSLTLWRSELPTERGPYIVFLVPFGDPPGRVIDEKVIDLSFLSAPGHWAASTTFEIFTSVDSLVYTVREWAHTVRGECRGEGFDVEIPDSSGLGKALLKPIYEHTLAVPENPAIRLQFFELARKATGRKRVHAVIQLRQAYPCESFIGLLRDMLSDPATENGLTCKCECYPARQYAYQELRKTSERPPRPRGYDGRCSSSYYSIVDGVWP